MKELMQMKNITTFFEASIYDTMITYCFPDKVLNTISLRRFPTIEMFSALHMFLSQIDFNHLAQFINFTYAFVSTNGLYSRKP